jgi:YVTN family beta-propeller protein
MTDRAKTLGGIALAAISLAACHPAKAPDKAQADYSVYVTNEGSDDLSIIDGLSHQLVATVPVGKRPRGVRVSPDGRTLYVALSGSPAAAPGVDESKLPPPDPAADGIGVFDIASRNVVRVIRGVSNPEQLAIGPNGKLYLASEETSMATVLDAATGKILSTFKVGGSPEGAAVRPDGKFVYITSEEEHALSVIDTATDKVVGKIDVGERPRTIAFSRDGTRAFVPGELDVSVTAIDAAANKQLSKVQLSGQGLKPMDSVVSPDGARLYVTTGRGGTVESLSTATLTRLGQVKVGARPWGVGLSEDGRTLYTANGPSNDVSVVDTQTMAVIATVKAGARPWGVAVGPAVAAK